MAQKRGFNFSLARHYDKAFAVVVLVALLVSLFVLARTAAESKERKQRFEDGVNNMRQKHPNLQPQSNDPYDMAVRSLRFPQTVRASTNDVGLFVPQHRVWCVVCTRPIPFSAAECPYCEAKQPTGSPTTNLVVDSEGRGITDKWRASHWKHNYAAAEDKSRADDDADSDGFTNLQEYEASPKTNPRDPKEHPDLASLLRFKEYTPRPFPFTLTGAITLPDRSLQLTFNMKNVDQMFVTKKGEEIGKTGLIYASCTQRVERVTDPRFGTITRLRHEAQLLRPLDGKTFVLKDNEPRAMMEQEIVLTLTVGNRVTECRVSAGGVLELEGQKYRVDVNLGVDEKPVSVVLENLLTGRKFPVSTGAL